MLDKFNNQKSKKEDKNDKNNNNKKFIPIVGDYGSGKSLLCVYVLYRLCNEQEDNKNKRSIIPIYLPLGQLDNRPVA